MSATVTAQLTANLQAVVAAALAGGGTAGANIPFPANGLFSNNSLAILAAGTGANKCDQLYVGTVTLAAGGTSDIDVHAPGLDPLGNTLALLRAKIVIIQNTAAAEADGCTIGNKNATSGWTSLINPNTGAAFCPGAGGCLVFIAPGATGFVIGAAATNHLLTFTSTAGSNSITLNVVIIGCSA